MFKLSLEDCFAVSVFILLTTWLFYRVGWGRRFKEKNKEHASCSTTMTVFI